MNMDLSSNTVPNMSTVLKRSLLLAVAVLALLASACGSDVVVEAGPNGSTGTSATPDPDAPVDPDAGNVPPPTVQATPTPEPVDDTQLARAQRELLDAARSRWDASRPTSYSFTYRQQCECDQGPWRVTVEADGFATARHLGNDPAAPPAPYRSLDEIFDEIQNTLDGERFPVEVHYDPQLGYPTEYIFNGPELAVDGGFVVIVDEFVANPTDTGDSDRKQLRDARARWQAAGLTGYDYTFTRNCFCPVEYVGPYEATTVNGQVVRASLDGVDLFDVEVLVIDEYGDLVLTVDEVFDEVERALAEAASYTVEYHPELGFPTSVFIDWDELIADEEAGYVIEDLVSRTGECSTSGVRIDLVPQPDLPVEVQLRRADIFAAAVACDIETLAAMTDPAGFNASFGGGTASQVWADAEARGDGVLLELVRLLNLDYTQDGEGADVLYVWPSAFYELEAPDGTGLDQADYEALLDLYPVEALEAMFEGLGGYVGYRVGIDGNGNWNFFVAGD